MVNVPLAQAALPAAVPVAWLILLLPLAVSPLVGERSVHFWTAARSRIENQVIRLTVAAALIPAAR